MLLTPFIDFGSYIEKFIGSSSSVPETVSVTESHITKHECVPQIVCVTQKLEIVTVNDSGTLLKGSGIAVASGPLDQSKAYFEIEIEQDGTSIAVGAIGGHPNSVVSSGWNRLANVPNTIIGSVQGPFAAATRLGVLIDISTFPPAVSLYRNDTTEVETASIAVRGDVWPGIEIRNGSARIIFDRSLLKHLTPQRLSRGIEAVMISRDII